MITELEVPYADVSAKHLTFRPDAPALPVLDAMEVARGELAMSLRLLGASHQAVITTPDGVLAETLAYRDDCEPDLPGRFSQSAGRWRHSYRCAVERLTLPQLRDRVSALRKRADQSRTLVGVFGEDPDAVTSLEVVGEDSLYWSTVHTYPQHGEVVTTTSSVVRVR
ncbi:DUF2617 family protein [Salininema proteolyticum]|uniref:DUF2617 family protein n=1 Tax=Salininema proteolyticum TaxID=1607685 RepID=A0ABV8TWA2_9ACTN